MSFSGDTMGFTGDARVMSSEKVRFNPKNRGDKPVEKSTSDPIYDVPLDNLANVLTKLREQNSAALSRGETPYLSSAIHKVEEIIDNSYCPATEGKHVWDYDANELLPGSEIRRSELVKATCTECNFSYFI